MSIVFIDIVGKCNLACTTCIQRTVGHSRSNDTMNLNTFVAILKKLDSNIKNVALYNWTDPFLHPELPAFIRAAHDHGLSCGLSTNFSYNNIPYLKEVVDAGPDAFHVSVSGFTQAVYGLNHKGGNIDYVKTNLRRLSKLCACRDGLKAASVIIRYLVFPHNELELPAMAELVDMLGFKTEKVYGCDLDKEDVLNGSPSKLLGPSYNTTTLIPEFKNNTCLEQEERWALDVHGDVYLCCMFPYSKRFYVGNFLESSGKELRKRMRSHPFCLSCKMAGQHQPHFYRAHERIDAEFKGKKLMIWGIGGGYEMRHADWIREGTKAKMIGFVDNNQSLKGTMIDGFPVYSPEDLKGLCPDLILVASHAFIQIWHQIRKSFAADELTIIIP